MKKILAFSFTALMLLGLLAGCAPKENPPAEGGDVAKEPKLQILETEYIVEDYAICLAKGNTELRDKVNTALGELKADGTVDKILAQYIEGTPHGLSLQANVAADAPTLTMATNAAFPPYEYYEGEKIVGIDADIAAAIADKLGYKLAISDMEFESILAAVQGGKADMGLAGMTVSEERMQSVDFTDSYATGKQVIIVKTGSNIKTVDDLLAEGANHKVGVQQNTTGDLYSTGDIEDKGLGTIVRYNKGADAVQALLVDKVDCVIIDNEPAKAFVESINAKG